MREDGNQLLEKGDLCGAEANVDLSVCDLAALCGSGGADLWMTVAEIYNTNSRCEIKELDALVGGNVCAAGLFEYMLRETANALCDVLFSKSCGIDVG